MPSSPLAQFDRLVGTLGRLLDRSRCTSARELCIRLPTSTSYILILVCVTLVSYRLLHLSGLFDTRPVIVMLVILDGVQLARCSLSCAGPELIGLSSRGHGRASTVQARDIMRRTARSIPLYCSVTYIRGNHVHEQLASHPYLSGALMHGSAAALSAARRLAASLDPELVQEAGATSWAQLERQL